MFGHTLKAAYKSDMQWLASYRFKKDMRLYKIKICGTQEHFTGLQALLTDGKKKLVLDKYGNPGWKSGGECEHFYVPDNDRISEMEVAYDYRKIVYIGFWTE